MKTILTAMAITLCAWGTSRAQSTFHITGYVPDMPDSTTVALFCEEGMEPEKLAECAVENDRFTLTGAMRHPQLCRMRFYVPGKARRINVCNIRVMTDTIPMTFRADTATILGCGHSLFAEAKVTFEGSDIQRQYMDLLDTTRQKEYTADSAGYAEAKAWFDLRGDDEQTAPYKERTKEARQAYEECLDKYLDSHPDDYPTAALLAQRLYKDFTYTAGQYDRWVELLRNNPDTAHVNFMKRNLDKAKRYALGTHYTDFKDLNAEGDSVSLSSLMREGRFTLIDFWASWCGPCRSAIPAVKELHKEMGDRLNIISLSVDKDEAAWKRAMDDEQMPWTQLITEKEATQTLRDAYELSAIPYLLVIDPEGGVVLSTHEPAVAEEYLRQHIKP